MQDCKSMHLEDIPLFKLLGLRRPSNDVLKLNLIGDNHHMTHFFPPNNGHRYVTQLNPTLDSLKPLLNNLKGPSLLWLRGCEQLLQGNLFPFGKFETLTVLEISGIDNLITLPKEISEMTQLQSLNLSHLPIQRFPTHYFFFKLTNLRSLVLKACPNLHSLPKFPPLLALVSLDLSHLVIEALPEGFLTYMKELRYAVLRGCSRLHSFPSTTPLEKLEILDLAHCITLKNLHIDHNPNLVVLDFSYTAFQCTIAQQCRKLTHVFARDASGSVLDSLVNADNVQVLDFSGAQNLGRTIQFRNSTFLQALDLSRTNIETLEFLSDLPMMFILSLRECNSLVELPAINAMPYLKVLDISRCISLCDLPDDLCELKDLSELHLSGCRSLRRLKKGVFDQMRCLRKLDLSETSFNHLPSFANLNYLGTHVILSHNLVEKVPNLSNLKSLNLEIVKVSSCESEGTSLISDKLNELHLVSTFTSSDSPFYEFKHNFNLVEKFILGIQRNMKATDVDFTRMLVDLKYILAKIEILESSDDHEGNARNLLGDLMYAVYHLKPDDHFTHDSTKLRKLLCLIVKLKLLVPHRVKQDSAKDMKDHGLTWHHEKEYVDIDISPLVKDLFSMYYYSLTGTQRNCLLYFAAIPKGIDKVEIKERDLFHLWYGEGLIVVPQQQHDTEMRLVKETGHQILKVLQQKGFIKISPLRGCSMDSLENTFVRDQAKIERFFNFDDDSSRNRVTPQFTGSQRACLLKSRTNFPSSNELWLNYVNSSKHLECFENVRTLTNINVCIIDIRVEWFSKMTSLCVLHLGRWVREREEHIEVVDLSFMEELKNMKELKLVCFEGVAAIRKLPDCFCKIINLKVLNLRECSDLQELPIHIGSLTNLAHLDVTNCPLLSMFPKGIKLLSKLEVLKGFIITYDADGCQNRNACTLADLLKLDRLRKLSLVVNVDVFPNGNHLQVFKEMKNLHSLQITWLKNNCIDRRTQNSIERKALKPSRWQQFKCWEHQTPQEEIEEPLTSSYCLEKLEKLVLCCFPSETAPNWLHPAELHNLEKLYIRGGHLSTLPGDPNHDTWGVNALHLDYTLKLDIDWESLVQIFPKLTFLKKNPKHHLETFPVDAISGLWIAETEEDEEEDNEDVEDDVEGDDEDGEADEEETDV